MKRRAMIDLTREDEKRPREIISESEEDYSPVDSDDEYELDSDEWTTFQVYNDRQDHTIELTKEVRITIPADAIQEEELCNMTFDDNIFRRYIEHDCEVMADLIDEVHDELIENLEEMYEGYELDYVEQFDDEVLYLEDNSIQDLIMYEFKTYTLKCRFNIDKENKRLHYRIQSVIENIEVSTFSKIKFQENILKMITILLKLKEAQKNV